MNMDSIKGTLRDAAGRAQERAGQVIGSRRQQLKGLQLQVVGRAQKAIGDSREVAKNSSRN